MHKPGNGSRSHADADSTSSETGDASNGTSSSLDTGRKQPLSVTAQTAPSTWTSATAHQALARKSLVGPSRSRRPSLHATSPSAAVQILPKTVKVLMIGGWYTVSISLHIYNKWLFSRDHFNFPFPMMTTTIHTTSQFILSAIVLQVFLPSLKPTSYPTRYDYLTKVLPCGIATGLDIGLSNSSLKSISLSFYTMVKSGAPVFILLFAYLFGLERPTLSMFGVISIIVAGVLIMVANETKFDAVGYTEAQVATVLSGLRWSLTQLLLKDVAFGMNNPLATNLFLAPIIAVSLVGAFTVLEGVGQLLASPHFATVSSSLSIVGIACSGGLIAFLLVILEFSLISETSVVTFSVAGIFKEIITIATSALVFGDRFTGHVLLGLVISIVGIIGYNYLRIVQAGHNKDADRTGHQPLPGDDTDQDGQIGLAWNAQRLSSETELDIDLDYELDNMNLGDLDSELLGLSKPGGPSRFPRQ
ncbi:triose-phosphate transporter family-domain-containing protein [Entophlyctis helioformis]|nr:triose-phosphate transporter family-domain-containing protein [Entophlyctis helioformis]